MNKNNNVPSGQVKHIYVNTNVNPSGNIVIGLLIIFLTGFYLLPTGIRIIKGKPAGITALINIFLGWTIIVWIIQICTAIGSE